MAHYLKPILISFIALINLTTLMAQEVLLTGNVSDENGTNLPGVNITIKGTSKGIITDTEGYFSLSTEIGKTLVFSIIGKKTKEKLVEKEGPINIILESDIGQLNEIVIIGYGTAKKATLTGAISSVKGTQIVKSPTINVSNSMAGQFPSLVSVTRSGEPGNDASTLLIRGVNTLGNNAPLIVVDGIPHRSLDRIDPASIESITVLKDASAAIYGSQAANGVLLITTKRGKRGKPKISINLNQGYNAPTRIPEMADAAEYATMLNEIDMYNGRSPRYSDEDILKYRDGTDPWLYPNTDWFNAVLQPWSSQNYSNVSISGGAESILYYTSFGLKNQDAYYKNSSANYKQYNLQTNLDFKLSKYTKLSLDLLGRMEDKKSPSRTTYEIYRMIMRGKPSMHAYWPDGSPGPDIEYGDNPVVIVTDDAGYDNDKQYIFNSKLNLDIKIPWIDGLSVSGNASYDKSFQFHKLYEQPWYLYTWDGQAYDENNNPELTKNKKGFEYAQLYEEMADNFNILFNSMIRYSKLIHKHNFGFLFGIETRTGKIDRFYASRDNFISTSLDELFAGGNQNKNNGGSAAESARMNYFGRINYSFSDKYLVEFVGRYDGSYIFPENERFGFFPGISAGWRVSEEEFWASSLSFINSFKIRASWGKTGNDRIDEWQYLSTYTFNSNDYNYIFGQNQENKLLSETRIPNNNVTWEKATQTNIGFESLFLDEKFSFDFDYFRNRRSDILWWRNASVPVSTGLSLPRENIAEVKNQGIEAIVGYKSAFAGIDYIITANGGYFKNEIINWDEVPGAPVYQQTTGKPIPTDPYNPDDDLYYEAIGIFKDEEDIQSQPHWDGALPGDIIFKDVNGDNIIDGNDRVRNQKTDIPSFTAALSLTLKYKNFDMSLLLQGATGAVRYIRTESGEIGNYLKDFYSNRWTIDNPDASYPRTYNHNDEYWRNNRNTFFLKKTDYLRLKNFEIGYTLPVDLVQKAGIDFMRIYVSGFNVLTYSPGLKDFDPESNNPTGQSYPLQKVFNGGVTLNF